MMSLAIVDRSDHLHQAVLHRDFDAEPAEFAAGLHLQVTQTTRIHVARMRIEPGEHAFDRGFNELRVVGFLDIVGAHLLVHVAKPVELLVGS
jgi:hypothetical protein